MKMSYLLNLVGPLCLIQTARKHCLNILYDKEIEKVGCTFSINSKKIFVCETSYTTLLTQLRPLAFCILPLAFCLPSQSIFECFPQHGNEFPRPVILIIIIFMLEQNQPGIRIQKMRINQISNILQQKTDVACLALQDCIFDRPLNFHHQISIPSNR